MVCCRMLGSDNQMFYNASMDCEILLNFQVASLEPNENGGYIMGSIERIRRTSDPLYFDRLDVSSATLGHMIPPALDFETMCSNKQDQNKVFPHNGGLSEFNEVIVTVVMVVAFLLLLRLLQLTASARSHDSNQKSLWFGEEMALLAIAFLYAAGAKFMLLVSWEKRRPDVALAPLFTCQILAASFHLQ